jgi:hypothetical protein
MQHLVLPPPLALSLQRLPVFIFQYVTSGVCIAQDDKHLKSLEGTSAYSL